MDAVLSPKQRRNKIRETIAMHTYDEIAKLCGVSKRTIRRDIANWRREGGYDEFLLEQFFKLFAKVKLENPNHAFDRICDLLRRSKPSYGIPIEEIKIKWLEYESNTNDKLSTT